MTAPLIDEVDVYQRPMGELIISNSLADLAARNRTIPGFLRREATS
jgi:hypothetical protein